MTSVLLVGAACARRRFDNTFIIQARTRTVVLQVFWAIQGRFLRFESRRDFGIRISRIEEKETVYG